MPRLAVAVLAIAALIVACGEPEEESVARTRTTLPATRTFDAAQRAAMLEILRGESAPGKVWFTIAPGDAEVVAVQQALQSVFEEAGWTSRTSTVRGMMLKPGMIVLVADEQSPGYVDTAVRALQATGLPLKAANGYRSYFEEMKRQNPAWPGVTLEKDQDYVVVIGPQRKS